MYDFQVVPSEWDTSRALICRFELPNLGLYTRACIVDDGDSPITCNIPDPEVIAIGAVTRGWDAKRDQQGNYRIHYVWRREQASEEGYFSCHNFGTDDNDPVGLYIVYPSEKLATSHDSVRNVFCIPLLQSLK